MTKASWRVVRIARGDPLFEQAWRLRCEVLLDPFGIEHARAQEDDARALHFGVFSEERCLASLMLVPLDEDTVRMRQVAVATELQGQGCGRFLVTQAEQAARQEGYSKIVAHVRETAADFYRSLGYEQVGGRFEQVGLPHFAVEKLLF